VIKHIVLFRAREGTPAADVERVLADLRDLVGAIPGLLDCTGGANDSPEGLSRGYTHGFVVTFDSAASRDGYLPHPEHRRVAAGLGAISEGVLVLDYEA
jgi:stress responsive alpha/beta barrel protein